MVTVISRIFNFGFKNFRRNGWLSTATVAIMALALSGFMALMIFGTITNAAAAAIENKIDISAYFTTNTPEDTILSIKQSLEQLPQVADVQYVSRNQALAAFKAAHQNNPTITQALGQLNSNPLEASLNIKAKDPSQYASIAQYLSAPAIAQYLDGPPSYYDNQAVIERLTKIVQVVTTGGFLVTILLALVAGLVVFNTIRIAIYSNREEIGVMRVVGASNAFVRGPYVVEGMICAAIAAAASLVLVAPVLYFISPYLDIFIPGLGIFHYFWTHSPLLFFYVLLFGVVIGAFSSFVAVRRYLKN